VDFFNDAELETYSKRLAIYYWLKKKDEEIAALSGCDKETIRKIKALISA